MKNIKNYNAEKYEESKYKKVEEGIYKIFDDWNYKDLYVTSLSFEQEPELDEGDNASDISQYPLEDLLDKYLVYVSDFYENMNKPDSKICYQEFASSSLEHIKELRSIIDKHVYNKEQDGKIKLVIE